MRGRWGIETLPDGTYVYDYDRLRFIVEDTAKAEEVIELVEATERDIEELTGIVRKEPRWMKWLKSF